MWDVWKKLFMEVVDKHAPLQSKRVSNKRSLWITHELTRKIDKRNYMKKIAIQENNTSAWVRYKQARNEVNNAIKSAKSPRKCRRAQNISEIKVNNKPIRLRLKWQRSLTIILRLLDQIWQVKYSRHPLTQNSIYNPRIQFFLLKLQALAPYAGF